MQMKGLSLNHVHVADSDATRALTISHWLEGTYRIELANEEDPEVNLDTLIETTPTLNTIDLSTQVAGVVVSLNSDVPGWNSVGSQDAKLGSFAYIVRKYLIGSPLYKAGPILIFGKQTHEQVAALSIDRFGFNLLKLPGVKYKRLPEKVTSDNGLYIAQQFGQTVSKWQKTFTKSHLPKNSLLLERNRLIASGLFDGIRRASRPLAHSYNALRATKQFHEVQPDGRWHVIDVLAIYADRHFQFASTLEGQRPPQFREILLRFHAAIAQVSSGNDQGKRIELIQEMSRSLSDLESLVTWWESLIAWSSLAAAHQKQTIHSLIVDDDSTFVGALEAVVKSKAFAKKLKEVIGRSIAVKVNKFLPDRAPEEVIKALRRQRIHEVDSMTGSPVVIFQDLILHGQADFGLRVIRRLRSRYPWLRIVALTSREKARFEILEAGADIYLNKTDLLENGVDGQEEISSDKIIENLRAVLQPGRVLVLGSEGDVKGQCFNLLCERYWLDPNPIPIPCQSTEDSLRTIRPESGPPRLLLVTLNQEPVSEEITQQLVAMRRLCVLFPELVIILWRPRRMLEDSKDVSNIANRWFEVWAKWIPDYASRVLPIDREASVGIDSPLVNSEDVERGNLSLLFSANELAAAESLLRRSAALPKLAAYNFYVPRRKSLEGATGPTASPTKVETEVADKIAARFGGSSVSVIHGRWIGEKGTPDYDTVVAIESFAPATRANRAFALEVVQEIRARLEEEAVLQIERPISVISRDEQQRAPFLAAGLCDAHGSVNGVSLYEDIFRGPAN